MGRTGEVWFPLERVRLLLAQSMTTFICRPYMAENYFFLVFQAEEPGILNNVPFIGRENVKIS
jgi:hypothetical protein